jgi:hypothetical protein
MMPSELSIIVAQLERTSNPIPAPAPNLTEYQFHRLRELGADHTFGIPGTSCSPSTRCRRRSKCRRLFVPMNQPELFS